MRTGVDVVGGLFTISFDANGCAPLRSTSPALRNTASAEYVGDRQNALVSVAVADLLSSAPRYCPTAFVGAASLGKTLLACGIAAKLRILYDPQEVLLYSGADFARATSFSSDTNDLAEFRRRLRDAAALIIDDVHRLVSRVNAQEEVIYAIDAFVAQRRPLVLTLSQAPADTPGLLPALGSRISGGLLVPLAPPGPIARVEILRRLAVQQGLLCPDDFLDSLVLAKEPATSDPVHIRSRQSPTAAQLQLAVAKLKELADESPLDSKTTVQLLTSQWSAAQPDLGAIGEAVARYFHQRLDELYGPARRKELVQARGIAMYLARQLTDKSLGQLGKHFGNRDHTTVLHACRKTQELMQRDAAIRHAVEELSSQFVCS